MMVLVFFRFVCASLVLMLLVIDTFVLMRVDLGVLMEIG